MTEASAALRSTEHSRWVVRVRLLSWATLVWLGIDGAIGMTAGLAANSVALIGWGLDCAIQAAAAVVLLWRFSGSRVQSDVAERRAQKVVAVSFFLLAPYILVAAINQLAAFNGASASWLGIALAATDVVLKPLLGRAKRKVGVLLGSHATASEGRQNIVCAYPVPRSPGRSSVERRSRLVVG